VASLAVAELAHGDAQDGVHDIGLGPDGVEQRGLGDELLRPLDEIGQHAEGVGRQVDALAAPPEALVHVVEARAGFGRSRHRSGKYRLSAASSRMP
jgi:hypothetical protein